jgi:acylphosphatase
VGWVKNTPQGTVVGVAQGEVESIKKIKHWLTNVGSPRSQIERCEFSAERSIDKTEFEAFTIVKKM